MSAAAFSPGGPMSATAPWSAPLNRASMTRFCSSRSDVMLCSLEPVRFFRFRLQYLEARYVGVPFDQRGDIAEAPQRRAVQVPYRIADRAPVGIDEQRLTT